MTGLTKRLQSLIAEMLDLPEDQITPQTQRADTENWDSLTHLHSPSSSTPLAMRTRA